MSESKMLELSEPVTNQQMRDIIELAKPHPLVPALSESNRALLEAGVTMVGDQIAFVSDADHREEPDLKKNAIGPVTASGTALLCNSRTTNSS